MRSKLYLIRLFYTNKLLFVLVLLFITLNLAVNFIFKAEQTPLFVWNLYSQRIAPRETYSFLEVRYNENEILLFPHTMNEPQKLLFTSTLDYFIAMKKNNDTDPYKNYIGSWNKNHPFFKEMLPGIKFYNDTSTLKDFPAWYKRRLEQHVKKAVYSIDIYEIKVAYSNNGELKKLSSTLIYNLL